MSKIDPTPSQRAAIERRGSAVLVSAGAGSGKTRVLTERLLAYLCDRDDPKDVDSFLIITFTRAAAAELRGRIMTELASAAAADPSNRHLRRQSALCRRANIETIDAFCAELLRLHGHSLGLAPDFRIIEDERAAQMKASALERTIESCYAAPEEHPGFLTLADTVGAGRDDSRLSELVLELHTKMQCHARPDQWAERMIELLRAPASDAAETPWGCELMKELRRQADFWASELERLLAEMRCEEATLRCYGASVEESAAALREFSRALRVGWDAARERLPIPFARVGGVRNPPDPELTNRVKTRRENCRDACRRMEKTLAASSEAQLAGMALTHDAMEALLRLTLDFDAEYAGAKRRASLLDYSDLEHFAVRLLTEEDGTKKPLAVQIAARFTEIMIDEYQDVSRVQDTIFRALSRDGRNLFMVGDVKQAIYRFRLADPEIFTEAYGNCRDDDEAGPGEARRIPLRENFRSRREILSAVNAVFSACMSRELGDVDYDEAAALRFGAEYYQGTREPPELLLLAAPGGGEEGESPDLLAREAEAVARRIEEMVRAGLPVTTRTGERPMRYGDAAILLRTVSGIAPAFRRALLQRGIPVAAAQGGEFFDSLEVSTLLSLLALLDNPHQDVPLIAVLRSPCFGFTADELSAIRAADRKSDFYGAICRRAEEDGKCRAFLERLAALRALAPDLGCAELVWQLIGELDLLALAGALDEGDRRRGNLLRLVSLSEEFEATGWRGLHRFVLWLRRLAEKGRESDAVSGEGVQILSIHKSKGLEFPVVFVCGLARNFNLRDSSARVLVHPELGLGAKVTDLEKRIEYPTLARTAIARRLTRETLSDEMRLLYVAMTRAREYLCLTACVKDPEKLFGKLRGAARLPLAAETLASFSSPLQWLVAAVLADGQRHLRLRVCGAEEKKENGGDAPPPPPADEAFRAELERRLSFRYPHAAAQELPSKVTATELKDRAEPDEDARSLAPRRAPVFRTPDFAAKDKPLSGAARGTATHLALQYMDFSKTDDEKAVRAEIERLRAARFLSDREAEAVDAAAIARLFASPLGQRMRGARSVRREFKFSLLCPAHALLGVPEEEDEVLLQGVVDCLIEEDGALTVVDYKTDAIRTEEQLAERRALYTPQLRAYAAAMERIFKKPVKACVLYFLSMGREAEVELG